MASPLTESREAVVALLQDLSVTVYGAPPEVVTPPAVLITAGDPWSHGLTWGKSEVRWTLTCLASVLGSNASAMERLEDLVWKVQGALEGTAIVGDPVAPRLVKVGTAEVAAADLPISVHVTDTTPAPSP